MKIVIARIMCVFVAALTGLGAQASGAGNFPERPMRIVVPYPPGGFNDILARTVADRLTKKWGSSVVVDNRPGGNTVIGNRLVASSPADGYTLLITPLPFSVLPGLYAGKLPYDALKDFKPVIWAGNTHNVLMVRKGLGASTVSELVALAKANPGKLNFGSAGSGSSNHLSMELLLQMADVKMTHVPYRGSAPAVAALLAGDIDALFENVPNVAQQIKAGNIAALAVTGSARSPVFPDLPTIAESGVKGYAVDVWFGIQAPGGTPDPIVEKLNQSIADIIKQPDVVELFSKQGVQVVASDTATFSRLLVEEVDKWGRVVTTAGIKID